MNATLSCIACSLSILLISGWTGFPVPDDAFLELASMQVGCKQVELVAGDSLRLARYIEGGDTLFFAQSADYTEVSGYNGVSNLAIVFEYDGDVRDVSIIKSPDTRSFVRRIEHAGFFAQFTGYTGQEPVRNVTGATISSAAFIETVRHVTGVVRRNLP